MATGQPDFDGIRRRYLGDLHALTGRSTIIYYSDWLSSSQPGTAITLEDMQAMMEVCKDLPGPSLDLLLHTPGGSAEAAASLVEYLRRKFDDIRVIVPLAAMSAGTMWALSADSLLMGKHSQLGPIERPARVTRRVSMMAPSSMSSRALARVSALTRSTAAWAASRMRRGARLAGSSVDAGLGLEGPAAACAGGHLELLRG